MADLAPDVRQVIQDRVKANEALTGDYEKDLAKGLVTEFKPDYDFGLNAQNDAISRKAKAKFYDPALDNLRAQQIADYSGKVQNKMKSAQNLAIQQYRYDNARALAAQQRVAQEEAQRAQMIGSLFQVAGTGIGAYLGGPSGAMVGSQAGASVGNSIGGGASNRGPGTQVAR